MGEFVTYDMNNGGQFTGYCDDDKWTLNGFNQICSALGLDDFNQFDVYVFTYDGENKFDVSLFDGRNVEIFLENNLIASRKLRQCYVFPCFFYLFLSS